MWEHRWKTVFDDHWDPSFRWVHPSACILGDAQIGRFAIIERDCVVGDRTVIGDFCKLMPGTLISEDCRFDDYANTSGAVVLGRGVMVKRLACVTQGIVAEDRAFIGPGVMVIHEQHVSWKRPGVKKVSKGIRIGSGAVIGGQALLLCGVDVGHNAWIAGGAVVTHDCDPYGVYVGAPARKVNEVPTEYHIEPTGQDLCFDADILERYLPDLVSVGRRELR